MARTVRTLFEFATRANTGGVKAVRDEIEAVSRETDELGNKAEQGAGQVGKLERGLGALDRAAGVAKKALAGFSVAGVGAVSAAVGVVGKDVLKTMDDMSLFQAQTGITTEDLSGYEEVARRIFELGLGDSFGDVAGAMSQVRAATGLEGRELESMTNQALRFQQVFGVETPESVRAVNTLMTTFGVDAGRAWDMVIKAQQNGANYAGDFADSIAEYSENYQALGFDIQQFMSMNAQASELGLRNTDVLNDSIREFGIRLNDGTSAQALYNLRLGKSLRMYQRGEIDGRQMFMRVQDALNGVENEAQRAALGAQIFGTKWEDETSSALLNIDLITADMMDVTGASERMAEALNEGPTMAFRQFTRAIKGSLRDALGPYIQKGVKVAIPLIKQLTREAPALVAAGAGIASVGAALLPLLAVASAAAPALGALGAAAAVAAGPLLLVAGAVAAFGLAYKNNWLGIQDKIKGLPDLLGGVANSLKEWSGGKIDLAGLKGAVETALGELKADPKAFVDGLKADLETKIKEITLNLDIGGIKQSVTDEINKLRMSYGDLDLQQIGDMVATRLLDVILIALPIIFGGPVGFGIGAAKLVASAFDTDFLGFRTALEETGIVAKVEDGANLIWDAISGFFGGGGGEEGDGQDTSALTNIINTITTTLQPLIDWLGDLGGNIEPGLTAIKNGIVGFIDAFKDVDTTGIEGALETIVKIVGVVIGGLIASLKPLIEAGSVLVGGMLESIGNWLPKLGEFLAGIINTISSALEGDFSGAATSFVDALGSLISGATGLAGDGIQTALDTLAALVTGFGDLVGVDLSGVGDEISKLPQTISEAATGLGDSVKTWITDKFKGAVDKVDHYFSNGGFDTLGGKLANMITGLPDWLADLPGALLSSITDKFKGVVTDVWDALAGDGEESLKSKLQAVPGQIEAALKGIGDAIKNKLVDPALEFLAPLINVINDLVDGIEKVGGWFGIGGASDGEFGAGQGGSGGGGGGSGGGRKFQDIGGRGAPGNIYAIGRGEQPELFMPGEPGRFVPKSHWLGGLAAAGATAGETIVHQWAGAELHFEGVRDIEELYRQINDLERRKNIRRKA